jgi:hypothetical protein
VRATERATRGRDDDYRYVWIRDECYTGQAVAADAPHPLLDAAVGFVAERLLADGLHLARHGRRRWAAAAHAEAAPPRGRSWATRWLRT